MFDIPLSFLLDVEAAPSSKLDSTNVFDIANFVSVSRAIVQCFRHRRPSIWFLKKNKHMSMCVF